MKDVEARLSFDETIPSIESYMQLVESTGWQGLLERGVDGFEAALRSSWYIQCAYEGPKLIGAGRVLSDGVFQALICDLIVLPEYQGNGVGGMLLTKLLQRCEQHNILMVQLFAASGKEAFYNKFGFEARPFDAPGMRWVNKTAIAGDKPY